MPDQDKWESVVESLDYLLTLESKLAAFMDRVFPHDTEHQKRVARALKIAQELVFDALSEFVSTLNQFRE